MQQNCPHCGTRLPTVVDAFCSECRGDLSETPEEAEENRVTWKKVDRTFTPHRVAFDGGCALVSVLTSLASLGAAFVSKDAAGAACSVFWIVFLSLTVYGAWKSLTSRPGPRDRSPD